jgi:hypothetical protein
MELNLSSMKALVSNTAKDNGNPGPDYKYGFGNLNALRAIKVLDNKKCFIRPLLLMERLMKEKLLYRLV